MIFWPVNVVACRDTFCEVFMMERYGKTVNDEKLSIILLKKLHRRCFPNTSMSTLSLLFMQIRNKAENALNFTMPRM